MHPSPEIDAHALAEQLAAEAKARRLHESNLVQLKLSWWREWAPLLGSIPLFIIAAYSISLNETVSGFIKSIIDIFIPFQILAVIIAARRRDRLWRAVIKTEAPELFAKITPDA